MPGRIRKQFVARPTSQPPATSVARAEIWKETLLQTRAAMNELWPEGQPLSRADVTQGQAAIDEFLCDLEKLGAQPAHAVPLPVKKPS